MAIVATHETSRRWSRLSNAGLRDGPPAFLSTLAVDPHGEAEVMQAMVLGILDRHRVMALATVCPDGWPQATTVNYVGAGMTLYALISRSSEKYANLQNDDRVSIAIGSEATTPAAIEGLSIRAKALELRDEPQRSAMAERLAKRNPGYFNATEVDWSRSALIRCTPSVISIINFSKGLGHSDTITIGAHEMVQMTADRRDDWGPDPKPVAVGRVAAQPDRPPISPAGLETAQPAASARH